MDKCKHKNAIVIVDYIDECKKNEVVSICKCGKRFTKKQWIEFNRVNKR